MAKKVLPLKEMSIEELFSGSEKTVYEIPIYQRNYAWEDDEISALVQDIYDAYRKDADRPYYIGTLVLYHKGDDVYEVIDGQQRLTTIRLLLDVLEIPYSKRLSYRARKKSDQTLRSIPNFDNVEEKDYGIENGYKNAKTAVGIVPYDELAGFISYFKSSVRIINYQVPKDIDLNHYFEVMNSRGEQLEKHEIIKANLMEKLGNDEERRIFNHIWECCSEMNIYTQQNLKGFKLQKIFGSSLDTFKPNSFSDLVDIYRNSSNGADKKTGNTSISAIIKNESKVDWEESEEIPRNDSFQPIIDFPNFLLIVLKITRMREHSFKPFDFILDDKELIDEFRKANMNKNRVHEFALDLLKARFLLDNYIVHHSNEDDTVESNPWKLQMWQKDSTTKKGRLINKINDKRKQTKLTHLLSMFEVSFSARQRKNYLFYCLHYLMTTNKLDDDEYISFVEKLADTYFFKVYLDESKLNAINTPVPGSFDEVILDGDQLNNHHDGNAKTAKDFEDLFGDGTEASKGVPLFVFNYLDYKLWCLYDSKLRGKKYKKSDKRRRAFFKALGCSDFEQKTFEQFYFSRTRKSLEHFYARALVTGKKNTPNQDQINCFGNYAMIGSDANSLGSNWSPKTKLDYYLDQSGKISQISVASLKFAIMMQICRDKSKWDFEEIKKHQENMLSIMMN